MIVLHRQRDSFVLTTDDAIRNYRVYVTEAQLCVQKIKLSDEKKRNILQFLPATPACYRIKRVAMMAHSLA